MTKYLVPHYFEGPAAKSRVEWTCMSFSKAKTLADGLVRGQGCDGFAIAHIESPSICKMLNDRVEVHLRRLVPSGTTKLASLAAPGDYGSAGAVYFRFVNITKDEDERVAKVDLRAFQLHNKVPTSFQMEPDADSKKRKRTPGTVVDKPYFFRVLLFGKSGVLVHHIDSEAFPIFSSSQIRAKYMRERNFTAVTDCYTSQSSATGCDTTRECGTR
jgi:hypothetical protein